MNRQNKIDRMAGGWDIIVIGGGITGAGIFAMASGLGLKCLLLEQRDFAWGTSSRSSKMVHGGLRYVRQGQFKTTWHSAHERQRLLARYPGLVDPMGFLFPLPNSQRHTRLAVEAVLSLYDWMGGRRDHQWHKGPEFFMLAPSMDSTDVLGGFSFTDASTDDSRLVMRVLHEGEESGGLALNYMKVTEPLLDQVGRVRGVSVLDLESGSHLVAEARAVINATGAWTDKLRGKMGQKPRIRPLRGSHLVLPYHRLPLPQAIALSHPGDGRAMYAMPWEGRTMLGTTDLDHDRDLDDEPAITPEEGRYILELASHWFPTRDIGPDDVITTFSGVRPVINTGKKDPSKESRDHVIWDDNGMVTVSGGKLTTFAILAREALQAAAKWLDGPLELEPAHRGRPPQEQAPPLGCENGRRLVRRLRGRYGAVRAEEILAEAASDGRAQAPDTEFLFAELRWSAAHESVVHLEDLMLRRSRLGLLLPQGGADLLPGMREGLCAALGWDQQRWQDECTSYGELWQNHYSPDLAR